MRLLSWIFQPVYIIFFVIVAALYLYRHEVIPEHIDSGKSSALVEKITQTVAEVEKHSQILQSKPTVTIAVEDTSVSNSIETESSSIQIDEVIQASDVAVVDTASVESVAVKASGPTVDVSVNEENAVSTTDFVTEVLPQPEPQLTTTPTQGTLWYAARVAAWNKDYPLAVERYKKLTADYPENADGFGELGNIYYSLGDKSAAVEAYQNALTIYQAAGYSGQSVQLQKAISEIQ